MIDLQTKITNEAYVLYEALVDLVSESTEKVSSAIERIESYFLDIEEVATEINFATLPTICQQLRQNLIQLPHLAPSKRLALIRQIERWPRLISNYLYSPYEGNHQLIDFLSEAQWPQPYPIDLAKKLCDSLSQDLTIENQKTNLKNPMSDLSNKIIEMSDTLSTALNLLLTNDPESETYLESLEEYTDIVQSFWELADKMDLKGFQEICLFINDNVFELYSQPQHKKQYQELFTLWPKRVVEYLEVQEIGHQNPTLDAVSVHAYEAEKLLELLCLESWPVVMSKAKASQLLTQLIQDNNAFMTRIKQSNDAELTTVKSNENSVLPEQFSVENEKEEFELEIVNAKLKYSKEIETEENPDQPSMNLSSETFIYDGIENEIELNISDASDTSELRGDLAAPNKDKLEQNIQDENAFDDENTYSELPFKNVLNHKNLLVSQKELVVSESDLFTDDEKDLTVSEPELFSEDEKDLTVSEPELFSDDKEWAVSEDHKLATVFEEENTIMPDPVLQLEMTDNQKEQPPFELLNLEKEDNHDKLEQEEFLMTSKALAADREKIVRQQSLAFEPPASEKESVQEFDASSEKRQLEQNLQASDSNTSFQFIIEKINEKENAILIELIAREEATEALLEAVMNYTENVQMIWEEAEQAALFGLTEVCTFINDNIMVLGGESLSTRKAARSVLLAWPQLMQAYLQAPQIGTDALLKLMQDAAWPIPLDESNALRLRENLTMINQPITEVPIETASMSVESFTDEASKFEASKQELMPTELTLPNAQLLIEKINEVAQENIQVIEDLIAAKDGSEAVLEAVMSYTENVQILWEEAEQAGFLGLTEICTFINDNLMVLGGEPLSTREAARSILSAWPQLMQAYLQAPQTASEALVNHFQNTAWSAPLDESNALILKENLTGIQPDSTDLPVPTESKVSKQEVIQTRELEVSLPNAQLLIEKINEVAQENIQVIEDLIAAKDGSEAVLEAVMSYTENVQILWEEAEQAGFLGLTEICTFINDNLMVLGGEPLSTREAARSVLLAWPQLMIAYLQAPQTGSEALVNQLQNAAWSVPLDESNALILKENLTAIEQPGTRESEVSKQEVMPATELEVSLPNAQFFIEKINEVAQENVQVIEDLIAAEDGSEAVLEAVMSYTENVQILWEEAEQAGFLGLTEICTFINDNLMILGGEPLSTRVAARSVLSDWPQLMLAYLQAPQIGSDALINHLQNTAWSAPLDQSNALILKENLTAIQLCSTALPGPTEAEASKREVMPATELTIPNAQLLIEKINQGETLRLIEELIAAEDGSEALLEAAMSYTENVQIIWETAEQLGLFGLTEVCTFLNDNVMVLAGESVSSREMARSVLAECTSKMLAYLQKPKIEAEVLVNHLQNTHWPTALDATAADSLLEKLLCVSPQSTVPSLIDTTTDSTVGSVVEEEVLQLLSQDILELVCNQISDSKEGFSAAIEVCVSMENEAEAFLGAIEEYTNKVQDIWDVAEMASLAGLQEVCTFVNDNLMAFSVLDKSQRLSTQNYFEKWPVEVLKYLQSPNTGAPNLVSFMQETGWPSPLEASLASDLLTTLLTPPQETGTDATPLQQSEAVAMETSVVQPTNLIQELPPLDLKVSSDISLGNPEVLEILISELEFAKEDLTTALNKMIEHKLGDPATIEALENYTEVMHRLYAASEMLGLEGLQAFCTFISDNITALSTQEQTPKIQAKTVLEEWPALVLGYLAKPADSVIPLINHLRQPTWAQPLTDETAVVLFNQLTAGTTAEEESDEENAYQRQTTAQPEDVLLTIPEELNRELLEAYLQETPQHAGDFSSCIQNIIHNPESSEIERAQRIAHTLKGSSNILGIKGIANIAHHLEDTLEYLAKHQIVPPQELTDTMVEAADCIEIMVDALLGQDDPPPQALKVLQSVLDWANRIDKGKLDAPPASEATESSAPIPAAETVKAEPKKAEANKQAADAAPSTPEQVLRVPTKTIDELMRLVGELSISVGQIQERLKHVMHNTRTLTDQNLNLQQKTFELENLVDVRGITGVENRYQKTAQHEDEFDPLEFEEYNELHSVAHSFIESIVDNRELAMLIREDLVELETMFIHQERLNKEFQNNIMTTRMVPVNTILSKLQRNVRQTCRMTGKKAELTVEGIDILIDSDVLNSLGDPLQHILRNAIDHGIENADERILLGKPESGIIKLSFYREGNNIVVKCEDNGQGLNYTNIRFTAIQRGLITENQELTEQELARLILMSGFSTKSGVTQVSGRGVGMDVVHTNIRQMKGTLDLMSKTGIGTTILIKLPMTLVTVHVLLVRVYNNRYGIPTNNLEQALAAGVGEFYKVGDEMTLKMGKKIYALKSLTSLLNLPEEQKIIDENETRPIILVRQETGITAVLVDELLDTHDLVMKNMGNYVKNLHGVAGAAILGDGALVPLLDLPELLRSPMQAAMSSMPQLQDEQAMPTGPVAIPHIMIVDDSLSVRKSLSLLVEDAGFETLLAKDGLEAIEMMHQTRPNVMLVDMEMPRMNGLELTAHVRANQATQNLPIFMITSRTTEKHREQAQNAGVNAYLTKPYQDTELLDLIDKALAGGIG